MFNLIFFIYIISIPHQGLPRHFITAQLLLWNSLSSRGRLVFNVNMQVRKISTNYTPIYTYVIHFFTINKRIADTCQIYTWTLYLGPGVCTRLQFFFHLLRLLSFISHINLISCCYFKIKRIYMYYINRIFKYLYLKKKDWRPTFVLRVKKK